MDLVVPAGETTAQIPVTATETGTYTVSASLGGQTSTADVQVLGDSELSGDFALDPDAVEIAGGGTQTFTITLEIPAPLGGAEFTLTETTGGLLPASVTVAQDQLTASFDFIAPDTATDGLLTATLVGTGVVRTATIDVVAE